MKLKLFFCFFVFAWLFQTESNAQCWKMVISESHRTMAIKVDGTLWAWGVNTYYQLGDGSGQNILKPKKIGSDTDWIDITGGGGHTVALKRNGTLWSWGLNKQGQLGNGNYNIVTMPSQIGSDTDWVKISSGDLHCLAIKSNGTLWAWGDNSDGQLGDSTKINRIKPVQIGKDKDWIDIKCGDYHSVAMKSNHTIWGWGNNTYGQYGYLGSKPNKTKPTQIGKDTDWVQISAGAYFTMYLKEDGSLWGEGLNLDFQLGDGTNANRFTPTKIMGIGTNCKFISAGSHHCICILKSGALVSWGKGDNGELGNNKLTTNYLYNPTQIGLDYNWVSISASERHCVALDKNGLLWSWGSNYYGQLGDGTSKNASLPQSILCNSSNSESIDTRHTGLVLYPNPTTGLVRINTFHKLNESTYQIINLTGKVVKFGQISNITEELNFSELENGIYLFVLDETKIEKITISK